MKKLKRKKIYINNIHSLIENNFYTRILGNYVSFYSCKIIVHWERLTSQTFFPVLPPLFFILIFKLMQLFILQFHFILFSYFIFQRLLKKAADSHFNAIIFLYLLSYSFVDLKQEKLLFRSS